MELPTLTQGKWRRSEGEEEEVATNAVFGHTNN
jgi:hypothetical protein